YPIDIAVVVEEEDDVDVVTGTLMMPGHAEIAVFPIPSGDELVIQGLASEGEMVLRSLSGKKVMGMKLTDTGDSHRIDIREIPKGLYMVEIQTAGGKYSQKIVKK